MGTGGFADGILLSDPTGAAGRDGRLGIRATALHSASPARANYVGSRIGTPPISKFKYPNFVLARHLRAGNISVPRGSVAPRPVR